MDPPAFVADLPAGGGTIRATTVALGPRALVIGGPSGSGKSRLAMELIALGAALVSDDLTDIRPGPDGAPVASCPVAGHPAQGHGLIEARGLGLIATDPAPPTPVHALLDLGREETDRLPPRREVTVVGQPVTLLWRSTQTAFSAALYLYLEGRLLDPDAPPAPE